MSTEENKAIVRRFFAVVLSQGQFAVVDELLAPTYVNYFPGLPEPLRGPEAFKHLGMGWLAAFPDMHFTVGDLIAEGDKVVVRSSIRAIHQGAFMGIPPTGKQVTGTAIDILCLQGGKIVDHWVEMDTLGLLHQLGAVPAPAQAS
jgi:predicted ester cyclase